MYIPVFIQIYTDLNYIMFVDNLYIYLLEFILVEIFNSIAEILI